MSDWLQLLSAWALSRHQRGRPTLLMNSDIAWQLTGSAPKENIRFWWQKEQLMGYAWYQPPCHLLIDIDDRIDHPVAEELIAEMHHWAASRRREFPAQTMPFLQVRDMTEWADVLANIEQHQNSNKRILVTSVFAHDADRIAALHGHGWQDTPHFEPHLIFDLANLSSIASPDSHRELVSVPSSDYEVYAAAHRDAWGAGSSFSPQTMAAVAGVGEVLDPNLILALRVEGEYAATSIFWRDDLARIGNIEPFGVRPKYRGTGAGQALIAGGLLKLQALGMAACRVYTAGFNHQAQGLYRGCGFQDVGVARTLETAV